jgi:hypothetical protein
MRLPTTQHNDPYNEVLPILVEWARDRGLFRQRDLMGSFRGLVIDVRSHTTVEFFTFDVPMFVLNLISPALGWSRQEILAATRKLAEQLAKFHSDSPTDFRYIELALDDPELVPDLLASDPAVVRSLLSESLLSDTMEIVLMEIELDRLAEPAIPSRVQAEIEWIPVWTPNLPSQSPQGNVVVEIERLVDLCELKAEPITQQQAVAAPTTIDLVAIKKVDCPPTKHLLLPNIEGLVRELRDELRSIGRINGQHSWSVTTEVAAGYESSLATETGFPVADGFLARCLEDRVDPLLFQQFIRANDDYPTTQVARVIASELVYA